MTVGICVPLVTYFVLRLWHKRAGDPDVSPSSLHQDLELLRAEVKALRESAEAREGRQR
ncbi:hypothetical protein ACIBG8_15580 [Nonomuraea sp. NPDC050556]|uniref:hypothetical protein n=1 Tax=Nonomuraea sp. NPDC050556 TaxID=3364369 RepID=UPI0037B3E089